MGNSTKKAVAARLVKRMRDMGRGARRSSSTGVDVKALAAAAGVTVEMARRYALGEALPDPDKLDKIAQWLGVRVAWLRDGDGDTARGGHIARQTLPAYELTDEAAEIAMAWSTLPAHRQQHYRSTIFLEAAVSKLFPWMRIPDKDGEHYKEFERRVEEDFQRLARQLTLEL
jgi:transcriptional regulator with XRE-family HTH domain